MRVRIIALVMITVIGIFSAGLATLTTPTVATVRAAAGRSAPLEATSAITYTAYLPIVMNCHPRQGPDPYFSYQYDMSIINADDGWGLCNLDASGVTIAIIDTGVDLTHPDLQANLLAGYDFVDNDAVPDDGNGHGTNVAGIAAAALNGIRVAGVAPTAKILPVRVLSNDGSGYLSDVAAGVIYAADHAQVLNLSLGSASDEQTLRDAINYAANTKGRLVVAAAGNCGDSNNYYLNGCSVLNQPLYPGAYPNVMAVAATTSSDTRASFSNVGSYVDIAAPGVSVYNTYYGNSYAYESGTSQATPHVAGLAALIWAKNPDYTASQVWSRIISTAVDLGAASVDTSFGAGRIDVQQALGLAQTQANAPEASLTKDTLAVVDQRAASIAAGRIIVKFKGSVGHNLQSRVLALSDAVVDKSITAINAQVLRVPAGAEWKTIDRLRTRPEVEYAEPDYLVRLIR